MNKEILKWYLDYIDRKRLDEIINRASVSIKGFTSKKTVSSIPTQLAKKNMLNNTTNYKKVREYLLSESLIELMGIKDKSKLMNLIKEGKEKEGILKFLIGSDEDEYIEEKEFFINEIKNKTLDLKDSNNLEDNLENSNDKIDEDNEVCVSKEEVSTEYNKAVKNQVEKLKKQIVKLEKNNNKLTVDLEKIKEQKKTLNNEKISLSKQINVLSQDINSLKKKLEASDSKISKNIENYNNLKNKYDLLIKKEKELIEENKNLVKESNKVKKREEGLKTKNKDLTSEIETIKKMLEKASREKIALIGEIEEIHLKGSNYEFEKIDLKKVKNLDELLGEGYVEVWVLLYELSSLDQSVINRKENKYKVFKFKNFEEVKSHMDNGR
ncbi:coiled-coil domain-containing protein [Clostridium perfringens]|uniref:coiled-coil domain-containing protein n=1 Tax=Clostridium perfringens TaxID=1502 RepID=UPI003BAD6042